MGPSRSNSSTTATTDPRVRPRQRPGDHRASRIAHALEQLSQPRLIARRQRLADDDDVPRPVLGAGTRHRAQRLIAHDARMAGNGRGNARFGHLPVQRRGGKTHLAFQSSLRQRAPTFARGADDAREGKIGEIEKLLVLDVKALDLRLEGLRRAASPPRWRSGSPRPSRRATARRGPCVLRRRRRGRS